LQALEKLAKEHDSTVGALTLTSVQDIAGDVTEVKSFVVDMKCDVGGMRVDLARFSAEQREQNRMQQEFMSQMARNKEKAEETTEPKAAIKNPKLAREKKLKEELKSFLRPDESTADRFSELRSSTTPDTCQWVFDKPEFQNWTTKNDAPILLITGPSGFGKSHLAASIVEKVKSSPLEGEDGSVRLSYASYFCDFDYEEPDEAATAEERVEPPETNITDQVEDEKVTSLVDEVVTNIKGAETTIPLTDSSIKERPGDENSGQEASSPATTSLWEVRSRTFASSHI
jgi:hypothetical protein